MDSGKQNNQNALSSATGNLPAAESGIGYRDLERLVRYAPGGIFSYSAEEDERFGFISANMLRLLGYTETEFREKFDNRFSQMVYEQDREQVLHAIAEQIGSGPDAFDTCRYRIEKKDGGLIWVHDEGHLVTDENGEKWFDVVIVDITDSVEANFEGALSRDELAAFIDSIPGGIVVSQRIDDEAICIAANQYYAALTARPVDEMRGYNLDHFIQSIHPDDRARFKKDVTENFALNLPVSETYRALRGEGGHPLWLHMEGKLVVQKNGSLLAYLTFYDISDQYEAELALRESERRYRLAIERAELAVWEYDPAKHCLRAPEGGLRLFGLPDKVADVPASILGGFDEESAERLGKVFAAIDDGETTAGGEFWTKAKTGASARCFRIDYSSFVDQGATVKAYGVGREITAQKNEEESFRATYRSLLAANPQTLCSFSLNLTLNTCEKGYGVSRFIQDVIDAQTADKLFENIHSVITDPHDKEGFANIFDRANLLSAYRQGTRSVKWSHRSRMEDGSVHWVTTYLHLMQNPDTGDIVAVLSSVDSDDAITESKVVQTLTDQDYDFIALVDVESGKLKVLNMGAATAGKHLPIFEKSTEVDYGQAIAQAIGKWGESESSAAIAEESSLASIKEHLKTNLRYSYELALHLPDGEPLHKQIRFSYLDESKRKILVVQEDITSLYMKQQEQVEKERRLRREAIEANEAKSEFLSSISHDMRTPLNGILGFAQLALDSDDPESMRAYLNKVKLSGSLLLDLVNDTLTLSKIESGKLLSETEVVDSSVLLRHITTPIKAAADAKGVSFAVDDAMMMRGLIEVDRLNIQKILLNLLSNAIKFTPAGGSVLLRVENLDPPEQGRNTRITVSDTGIGIGKDFLPKIYEPFAQEYNGTVSTAVDAGTGLGLSIVRQLVNLMDGTIALDTERGKGSTFVVMLNIASAQGSTVPSQEDSSARHADLAGKKVLLCEDNYLNTEIARTLLEKKGLEVVCSPDGKVGLETFEGSAIGEFAAILMDIRMPKMDGYETTRAIRALAREDAKNIPIIAMTADAYAEDVAKCLATGMNAHIPKPIDPENLFETLRGFCK